MATIVRHKETGAHYLLLGAGLGAYKSSRPSMLFGNLAPVTESGEIRAVLLGAHDGSLRWIKSECLELVSVDGQRPGALLEATPEPVMPPEESRQC